MAAGTRVLRTNPAGYPRRPVGRTLVICKPDAVERGLVGEIVGRLEAKGLRLVAAELRAIDQETAAKHYAEHEGKPFYDSLVAFITRGPALLLVVEGPDETHAVVRALMGATNPRQAAPGTIRGDLALDLTENLVHGSDSTESAEREIALFFPELSTRG
jgi:nucleoside-diphosphate kinase